MTLPTGTQYTLRSGETQLVVAEVGATLRRLTHRGREIFWAYPDDDLPVLWSGTTLVPWPNRIRDGRYVFDGEEHLLPVNEPERGTALHGLAGALEWRMTHRSDDALTLAATIYPQPGWAGVLRVEVTHTVGDGTVTVDWRAENVGTTPVPFGYGSHPYFLFDDLADVTLSSPFDTELRVDDRLLPTELGEVTKDHDFRQPHPLGAAEFDTAFTDAPKQWVVRLDGPEHAVTIWADERHPWMQCYTHPKRHAIAIEPMTCGPDAFNEGITHAGVLRLEPGDVAEGSWGVRVG